jgi:hypothetical protein
MSYEQLAARILGEESRGGVCRIRRGDPAREHFSLFLEAKMRLKRLPLSIDVRRGRARRPAR